MASTQTLSATMRGAIAGDWRQNRLVQDRIKKAIAYIICTFMAIIYVFPLYWLIATALKSDKEIFLQPPTLFPAVPQWQNFGAATTYIPFWQYMLNTFLLAGVTIIGTLIS